MGQGPLEADVRALHAELKLEGVMQLPGHRPDAVRLMAGCDAFALSSQWEGLPVALKEEQPIAGRSLRFGSLLTEGYVFEETHPVPERVYAAGALSSSNSTNITKAFIEYLQSPEATSVFEASGAR